MKKKEQTFLNREGEKIGFLGKGIVTHFLPRERKRNGVIPLEISGNGDFRPGDGREREEENSLKDVDTRAPYILKARHFTPTTGNYHPVLSRISIHNSSRAPGRPWQVSG